MKTHSETVRLNRRRSIREKCLNCSEWSTKDVQECPFGDCPLHPYRTGKGNQNPKQRDKAIRSYCLWCCNGQPSGVRLFPIEICAYFGLSEAFTDLHRPPCENTPIPHAGFGGKGNQTGLHGKDDSSLPPNLLHCKVQALEGFECL